MYSFEISNLRVRAKDENDTFLDGYPDRPFVMEVDLKISTVSVDPGPDGLAYITFVLFHRILDAASGRDCSPYKEQVQWVDNNISEGYEEFCYTDNGTRFFAFPVGVTDKTFTLTFGTEFYDSPAQEYEFRLTMESEPSSPEGIWQSEFIVLSQAVNTGYKGWQTLEEYYVSSGVATGNTKQNDPEDPDYVPPVYDPISCPL